MKKLMLTSALAGVMISGNAIAQTSITGELRVGLKTIGSSVASGTTTTSNRGFGTEQQINVQTKGKLNVGGIDYAAGFAIENDGLQTTSLFNENSYMDFTFPSKTTVSFSMDHIQRSDTDRSAAVLVGFSPNELSASGASGTRFAQHLGPRVGQSWTASVLQATDFGTFSYSYAPTNTDASSTTTTAGNTDSELSAETDVESAYEYGFVGGLGVKGLNTYYFKSQEKQKVGQTVQQKAKSWGISYNFGDISVGYADKKHNTLSANSVTEKHYGVSYAVNKDMTVGLIYAKAEATTSAVDQKVKGIQLGYNLGPVALTASVARNTDIGGSAGTDSDMGMIRLIGAF